MIVWTIQHKDILKDLEQFGVYHAKLENSLVDGEWTAEKKAIQWFLSEMEQRIQKPSPNIEYPIWTWFMWEGRRKKPDLRKSGYAKVKTPIVLMELEIPKEEILLSNFDLWHIPLNSESDWKDIENTKDWKQREEKKEKMFQCWSDIFDLQKSVEDSVPNQVPLSVQGTFWELKPEYILSIKHYTAR